MKMFLAPSDETNAKTVGAACSRDFFASARPSRGYNPLPQTGVWWSWVYQINRSDFHGKSRLSPPSSAPRFSVFRHPSSVLRYIRRFEKGIPHELIASAAVQDRRQASVSSFRIRGRVSLRLSTRLKGEIAPTPNPVTPPARNAR